jgi:pyroglutamyl-peptidase
MPSCLVTAFGPFGPFEENPSWLAVAPLESRILAGHRIATRCLPVAWDEATAGLLDAIAAVRPRAVIACGVGAGGAITLEGIARNGYLSGRPLDVRGAPPPRREIVPGGPPALASTLPLEAIAAALAAEGIAVRRSTDAGGYLCNELFYGLLHAAPPAPGTLLARGFVHVPPLGSPDPCGGSFDEARLRRAVELVVETTLRALPPFEEEGE